MTFGGEGVMAHEVLQLGVAKVSCMSRWEWLFVTLRRGGQEVGHNEVKKSKNSLDAPPKCVLVLLSCSTCT